MVQNDIFDGDVIVVEVVGITGQIPMVRVEFRREEADQFRFQPRRQGGARNDALKQYRLLVFACDA